MNIVKHDCLPCYQLSKEIRAEVNINEPLTVDYRL
jgi:hypothetical protein